MKFLSGKGPGIVTCFAIAVVAWLLGQQMPIVGGAVFAILIGMLLSLVWTDTGRAASGIKWTSKVILQTAVVLLGFGLDLHVIVQTGMLSLPIIVGTISTSLIVAWVLHRALGIEGKTATLVGVGSSICGGSAIAATAPVIKADDEMIAQSIAVIFFYNVIAAVAFPWLGTLLGFDTGSGAGFGMFAGTAVNDTSSVTAAAATWDSMWSLGTGTLDTAVTVKLTRTLAIIPITLLLAIYTTRQAARHSAGEGGTGSFSLRRAFPMFILYFIIASIVTTLAAGFGVGSQVFAPLKDVAKFCIMMAMAAIGLNSNVIKLVRTGGKPLLLGAICWLGITLVSLGLQHGLGIW